MHSSRSVSFVALLVASAIFSLLGGCGTTPRGSLPATDIQLTRVPTPPNVFTIADEIVAFQAQTRGRASGRVHVSLAGLRARVGGFNEATVFEFDGKKRTGYQQIKVGADAVASFRAVAGRRYLVHANLGSRYVNAYRFLCRVKVPLNQAALDPICLVILCAPDVMRVGDVLEQFPELARRDDLRDLREDLTGGFGQGPGPIGGPWGNPCDRCLDQSDFVPDLDCPDDVDWGITAPQAREEVVYTHKPWPFTGPSGPSQIYKMFSDGSGKTNLSNNSHNEGLGDVRPDGKRIVFKTTEPGSSGIHLMDTDGSNRLQIPGAPLASYPRWNRESPWWIVMTSPPPYYAGSAIARIALDGTGFTQLTQPGPNEKDEIAEVLDKKHIVFVRMDQANGFDRDLYLKNFISGAAPQNLTNTPNRSETLPVVSHGGDLLAYRVFLGSGQDDQVHVAQILQGPSLNVLHKIDLQIPADINISGIDFSKDDSRLYISTQANDVAGNLINRKSEIFSVKLDGSDQKRLTTNIHGDTYPSTIP